MIKNNSVNKSFFYSHSFELQAIRVCFSLCYYFTIDDWSAASSSSSKKRVVWMSDGSESKYGFHRESDFSLS